MCIACRVEQGSTDVKGCYLTGIAVGWLVLTDEYPAVFCPECTSRLGKVYAALRQHNIEIQARTPAVNTLLATGTDN